uniref:Uncharacterized protein n=1 Tax=Bactrocera latifrons TaxID=174628 RepID=A0A0K8VB83_BACLA
MEKGIVLLKIDFLNTSNVLLQVWIDWKCYIKRKLSANKKEIMSTGGGQCRLQRINPLEEKVIALTGLETCTSGISGARDYGDSAQVQDVAQTSEMDISACSEDRNEIPSCSRVSSQRRERRTDKESASSLLKEQIALQKEFYEDTKNHNEVAAGNIFTSHESFFRMYGGHRSEATTRTETTQ